MDKDIDDVIYGISKYNNTPGVICYMNSIIAILQQTPIFADYILTGKFKDKLIDKLIDKSINKSIDKSTKISNSILFQFYNLLNISHIYDNYKINPDTFRNTISKKDSMWGKSQHQDSQEFLTFLLNNIEEEIAEKVIFIPGRNNININNININNNLIDIMANNCWQKYIKNEFSIIKNLFGGLSHIIITCSYCGNKSHNFDLFQVLQLSIPNNATNIYDCLDEFTKEEKVDYHNMIKCDFCGRFNKSTKQTKLYKLPKILIIQLKRFRVNNYGIINQKIDTMIEYPINNLQINNLQINNLQINNYNYNYNYKLFGVNCHHSFGHFNSINFGHYTSNVINRFDNKWYCFDDSKQIVELNENEIISKNAYMLFYIRDD
jgi:ubiquitin C-terminal hydrolase